MIASFLLSFIFSLLQAQNNHQPNILFIMADDLTMTDTEPFGSRQVHTPNMARLAKDSARASLYVTRPEEELYDLKNDPFELHNIAADQKYQTTKTGLRSQIEAFMKQQRDKGIETEMQALTRQPKTKED